MQKNPQDTVFSALQATVHELQSILNLSATYIYAKDREGRYTYVNQQILDLFNTTYVDIIGRDDSFIFDKETTEKLRINDRLVIETGKILEIEESNVGRTLGEKRVYWTVKSPLHNQSGEIIGLCGISTDITSSKITETELRASNAKLEAALANMSDAVCISDADGKIIQFNEAFASFHHFRNKPACAKTLAEFPEFLDIYATNGELQPLALWPVYRALRGETSTNLELQLHRKDTNTCWIGSYNYAPIRNEQGVIVGSVVTARDITERKHTEETLKKSRLQLESFIRQAPICIAMFDANMNYLATSDVWLTEYGSGHSSVIGKNHYQIFPDLPDRWRIAHQQGLQGGSVQCEEDFWVLDDGSKIWSSWSLSPWIDEQGKIGGIIIVSQDITARKQAEENLLQSERQLRFITDHSSVCIAHYDHEKRYKFVNQPYAALFGMSPSEIIGKPPSEVLDKQTYAYAESHMDEALAGLETHYDLTLPVSANKPEHVSVHYLPEFDADGRVVGFVVAITDITERKKSEQQLRIAATAFEGQEGMLITDANNVILQVNQSFTSITGYLPEEVIGQTPHLLKSGIHNPEFYNKMWASIRLRGQWQGEIWNRRKNGETYPELLTITAVKNEQGVVTNYVATMNDITERKYSEDKIKQLAYYDQLTQLPNRTLLHDRLKQAFATSARSELHGALLFIDLDNFKQLNDTLGHHVGDLLLQKVAERLLNCVREGDTVARIGGDEFVIILENLDGQITLAATQSESIGEKILASLSEPYDLNHHEYIGTPSVGFALFQGHGISVDNLLKQADIAMYQAKAAGRNTLRFFDQNMQDIINRRATIENELYEAILNQRFVLYFQPQVDSDGQIFGAEALVRWQHPEHGIVSPCEFIPLAEETGLIQSIGHWVLEAACLQLVAWSKHPATRNLQLAVNVSAHQFRLEDFVKNVQSLLQLSGADPSKLKLELTESILVDSVEDVVRKMTALKMLGVRFSLDDFGTGYSSLAYLKRLPLDQLKIDQSFVRDLLTDANDAAIARTIVALAQSMGLSVIAEGVETQAQHDFLAIHGCQHFQGNLFGEALPIEQFDALFR